jgi:tetratricopeptide (TPR) repeat protein
MRTYRTAIQSREGQKTSHFMASHEMTDYSIGRIEELKGDLEKARQEYDTALIENLGFVPAHVALGRLAVARHDTAEALKEFDQATQTLDPLLDYTYGILLWASRRAPEAATHFSRAIAADPDYSPPYLSLAYIEEGSGEDSLAVVHYQGFIARAAAALVPQLATAHQHLDALLATKKAP